jgi:adenylate cyclase
MKPNRKGWTLPRRQRRLAQSLVTGLAVAGAILLVQWVGLFSSARVAAADYLYETQGIPGDDIVIVAIDEKSQKALGDWPWPLTPYVALFERLKGADVVGLDVLLPDPGPEGNPDTPALIEAVRQAGNVVMPLTSLELLSQPPGKLYSTGQIIQPFPALLEAAASAGMVAVTPDIDGTLRRVPLLMNAGPDQVHEAFGLRILRLRLNLGDAPASLENNQAIAIGDESEVQYETVTNGNGAMYVNYVGRANTFPVHSFIDVIQDRIDTGQFEDKIVLVGMMNTVSEMDLHQTPVSASRMAGIEFQANAVHTLLHHRALRPQGRAQGIVTVLLLAVISAAVLSQLGAIAGIGFTLLLGAGYFMVTNLQFNAGRLPDVLFPYATVLINYTIVTAVRFASERVERNRVTDVFGRFVSAEVRNAIVNMALDDPDLIQPGGRLMEISVLFADIRGFTSLSEKLPPPEVVEILNLYLDSMEAEVFKQGGTLDKYTGDGMMVLFGTPLEQPDHAERAVRAALAMQQAAAEVSQQRGDVQWTMKYGIGITTGPAVVGQIGSQRRLDYTAVGDTVNLASRLEGKAPPGTILVNRATYEAVKDMAIIEQLEPMMVKGKAEPVVAYKVLGLREGER